MILKRIACYPKHEAYLAEQRIWNRETFSHENVGAYIMAVEPEEVLILQEWPNQPAVDRFMAGTHERLMQEHPLGPYLHSYRVEYFDRVEEVAMAPRWDRIAAGKAVIRHTECRVDPALFGEFMDVQRKRWSPGMSRAAGFVGGRIWRRRDDPSRVLLVTYFIDATAHQTYRRETLPQLRYDGARSLELCSSLEGKELKVVEVWSRQAD